MLAIAVVVAGDETSPVVGNASGPERTVRDTERDGWRKDRVCDSTKREAGERYTLSVYT